MKRFWIVWLLFVGCASSNWNTPLDGTVELHGHRGARGLSPENTLPSFFAAIEAGMTRIELDVVLTGDDNLIIHHDTYTNPSLCRTIEGRPIMAKPIRSLDVAELKRLDCGSKVNGRFPNQKLFPGASLLTLSEFFESIREYEGKPNQRSPILFNVELKVPKTMAPPDVELMATLVVKTLKEADVLRRSLVQSFFTPILTKVKKLNPELTTAALFRPTATQRMDLIFGRKANRREIIDTSLALGVDIVAPHLLYITRDFVKQAHRANLKVIPWTVNDEKLMKRLMELGVDGIISDYPDRLSKVFSRHQSGL